MDERRKALELEFANANAQHGKRTSVPNREHETGNS